MWVVILSCFLWSGVIGLDSTVGNSCVTQNNTSGICVNIKRCPSLLSMVPFYSSSITVANLLKSTRCGFEGMEPIHCCSLEDIIGESHTESPITPTTIDKSENLQLLPDLSVCGSIDFVGKIVGATSASLGEYPWMALLEYKGRGGFKYHCGGSLINNRYVLTAAHCVKSDEIALNWNLTRVRLGEYNIETDPDCVMSKSNTEICAPSVVDVVITKAVVHEHYNQNDINRKHDIALLRLESEVQFTDFVKPICLPIGITSFAYDSEMMISGWGRTENNKGSNVKLKLQLGVVNNETCASTFNLLNVNIGKGQICAGGEIGKDSCQGDSGGPLMVLHGEYDLNWFLAGIISFGMRNCGAGGWPGIYTNVSEYIPWILNNLGA